MSSFGSFLRQTFLLAAWAVIGILAAAQAHAFLIPAPDQYTDVFELVNDNTGRFTWLSADEFNAVFAQGSLGPGWRRTGLFFTYHSGLAGSPFHPSPSPVPDRVPVCRFHAAQIDAYFFTANMDECRGLRAEPASGWVFQGTPFTSAAPTGIFGATCPSGTQPLHRLYRDGGYRYIFDAGLRMRMNRDGWSDDGVAFCEDSAGQDPLSEVVELVNANTARYVWLTGAELAAVEQGSAGPGWRRTGYRFGYFGLFGIPSNDYYGPQGLFVERFYAQQTNSHFFTSSNAEILGLRNAPSSGWRFEGEAFPSTIPSNGGCPGGSHALYRLYRDGGHSYRYVFDATLLDRMLNDGWTYDGLAFCEEFVYRDRGS